MDKEKLFLSELTRLRDRLRNESKSQSEPVVCEDSSLKKLAKEMPTTKEGILKIEKIDYRYLPYFLNTIKRLKESSTNFVDLTLKAKKTLIELEKKLVDINKRNRMLYLPKLPLTAFDLTKLDVDPFDILFRKKVVKITVKNEEAYKTLNGICRDVLKNYRDRGLMDLYVGYPFVKGKINNDDFYIHAPLALFPIKIEKEIDYITLRLDLSKDITYNTHLLLANYKFKEINKPLPNVIIDDLDQNHFINNLIDFYASECIRFYAKHDRLSSFIPLRDNELKYFSPGDFSLEGYAVLGRFSSYSTVIQNDFELMLEEGISSPILLALLDNVGLKEKDMPKVTEEELSYVGDLNSSQEEVIEKINRKDALVVEGPPGTGKSQTITSLVTNYVLDGKNVLIVSEKKAALDVVYSRLGTLNKYALQIDDINDKNSFYESLNHLLAYEDKDYSSPDLDNVNKEITKYMERFNKIEETFYSDSSLGVPVAKLYQTAHCYDLNVPNDKQEYNLLSEALSSYSFAGFTYQEVKGAYNKLSDDQIYQKLSCYKEYENTWLSHLKEGLSAIQIVDLRDEAKKLANKIDNYNNSRGISKLGKKGSIKKECSLFVSKYFLHNNKSEKNLLLENSLNPDDLYFYDTFMSAKKIFASLTPKENYYLEALICVVKNVEHDYLKANGKLLNYIFYLMLTAFENDHSDVLADIRNYQEIVNTLDSLFANKKKNVKLQVEAKLANLVKTNILDSSNYEEINHNINSSKRKYNIKRFINKYYDELQNGIRIWLMTPEVVSEIFSLFGSSFDLVIFDEASQLYIEKSIPTIFRAKKLVIAGDSKQLRPSSLGSGRLEYDLDEYDEDNIALEEESLLDLARYKFLPPVVLNFHYRSKYEELIAFSNYAFYEENLYVSPNTIDMVNRPIEVYKLDNGRWENRRNIPEALKVIEILKDFFKNRKNNETIGIITFNSQQRDLVEDYIDLEASKDSEFAVKVKEEMARKENGEDIGLFVKNIENVQGDERDVIVFSVAYAKNEQGRFIQNFGWLNQKGGENRLNVAITRARKKVIVVTSILPTDLKMDKNVNNGPKYLKKYLEYCFEISNKDNRNAKQTLYSLHESDYFNNKTLEIIKEVYQEIRRRGFTALANVGIGKYSIDIAVKQDDKYILGIEFDTKLFKEGYKSRERDYFRQKYLESRGWNIYRVWSMNWWKSKETEINRIMDTIYSLCSKNEYLIEE